MRLLPPGSCMCKQCRLAFTALRKDRNFQPHFWLFNPRLFIGASSGGGQASTILGRHDALPFPSLSSGNEASTCRLETAPTEFSNNNINTHKLAYRIARSFHTLSAVTASIKSLFQHLHQRIQDNPARPATAETAVTRVDTPQCARIQ